MNKTIQRIFDLIDCNKSEKEQKKGIELALEVKNIAHFVLPMYPTYNKNVWENCAKIISLKNDAELVPYLLYILEWLQDLNWPGTWIIIEKLCQFNGELLVIPYLEAISKAKKHPKDDQQWYYHLTVLLRNETLRERLCSELLEELSERYKEFWF